MDKDCIPVFLGESRLAKLGWEVAGEVQFLSAWGTDCRNHTDWRLRHV